MRLWTWQKHGFDLTDQNVCVESLENSHFLNDINIPKVMRVHFIKIYKELYKRLETDQFHWYFIEEDDAKCEASHLEFYKQNRVLWEVEIPDGNVFQIICDITWNRLLKRCIVPLKLRDYWERKANYDDSLIDKWKQDFNNFWESKSEDELWDLLFLDECVDGCTQVILYHPLDDLWVIRNPIKEGKWWDFCRRNRYGPTSYTSSLPCTICSGRKQDN